MRHRFSTPISNPVLTSLARPVVALAAGLLLVNPGSLVRPASPQPPFFIISISPVNGATGVSPDTAIGVTFSLRLDSGTVNQNTFQVLRPGRAPITGSVTAVGAVAVFSPNAAFPTRTPFEVRILGGANGVHGSVGGVSVPLEQSFTSTFTTGVGLQGEGTDVPSGRGGSVMDSQGSGIIIPPNTLKTEARVRPITLDSPGQIGRINNRCGVPIEPGEDIPGVRGFVQATELVRYEGEPCGTNVFGPGMRLTLRLQSGPAPGGLLINTRLRLFELARSRGQLVFQDTGIVAKVTGPGSSPLFGDFVTVPNVQVFGTFAAFLPSNNSSGPPRQLPIPDRPSPSPMMARQPGGERLYFPIINQLNGRQTRISIANPDPSAGLNVRLSAYTGAGVIAGTQTRTVMAHRQATYPVSELFPGFGVGAIVVERQGSGAMTGFYEISDDFLAPTMLGGAEGIQSPQTSLVFPVIKSLGGGLTEIYVHNPQPTSTSIKLAGFAALGSRVDPTDALGQPLSAIALPPHGTLVLSSAGMSSPSGVRLDFTSLDGGYIVVEGTEGQPVTGGQVFGELMGGQLSLAVLNGLPFPSGCVALPADPCTCHVDPSPESPVPGVIRQHTLYAAPFEDNPNGPVLHLVNVSDRPSPVAVSAFSEQGQFRATFPRIGFIVLNPHQVLQAPVLTLFGFNPAPGYVRVEDPGSSFVGALMNRVSGNYVTAVPLVPDDPRLTPTATDTFFSRVDLSPPLVTGILILNPNNNVVRFTIAVTEAGGAVRQSPTQTVVTRGAFVNVRQSLAALFPGLTGGFAQVEVTRDPGAGSGGRVIPFAVYRSGRVVSAVPNQNKQP